jgi:hypothetical protein
LALPVLRALILPALVLTLLRGLAVLSGLSAAA